MINRIRHIIGSIALVGGIAVFLVVPGLARCGGSVGNDTDNNLQLSQSSFYEEVLISEI